TVSVVRSVSSCLFVSGVSAVGAVSFGGFWIGGGVGEVGGALSSLHAPTPRAIPISRAPTPHAPTPRCLTRCLLGARRRAQSNSSLYFCNCENSCTNFFQSGRRYRSCRSVGARIQRRQTTLDRGERRRLRLDQLGQALPFLLAQQVELGVERQD